jgi:alpha-glucosidase (family GH31 glycosyl hydrolase)
MSDRRPRRCLGAICVVTLLAVLSSAAAGVSANGLGARIQGDPWRLTVVDANDRPILVEAADRSPTPAGALGFRTAGAWRHATRAVTIRRAGRKLIALLETTDPQGRRLAVRIAPAGDGVVSLVMRIAGGPRDDVEALGIGFEAHPDERFFGFGERATAVEHRGRVVEDYVSDGPFQAEERPLVRGFVPQAGFRARDDATYYPVPWLLSSRGFGVLVDNADTSYFRLATDHPDRWSVEVTGAPEGSGSQPPPADLRLRVFSGPRPADALRRFTARTGRQPEPAAPWVLGPWIQLGGSREDRLAQMAKLRAADAPASVVQTYTHYLPCGDHVGRRDDERALVQDMHATGAAVTTYFNPMICASYEPPFSEAVAAGALTRDASGGSYVYNYTGTQIFRVGQYDLSTRTGRAHYARRLAEAAEDGHDGWMEDFGEYTPLDAFAAGGLTGSAAHNLYPLQYHCGAYDFVRRQRRPLVRFQRSGWTGAARCAQVVWGGDPSTDWGFDGLASALSSGLGMGLSGVALWGSDIGGFFALGERALTPELLIRWVQLGAVSGVMRTQHNGFALPTKVRPQIYDDGQIANWKRYAKLRTQLYPYLVAAVHAYRRTGVPLMRHLVLGFPDDPAATARDDEFLLGPDLLVAPVLEPGAMARDVYLPGGGWVDVWRAAAYDSAGGGFVLGAATVLEGGRTVTLPAPLEELPFLARAGAILPLLPPDVDTLADYGDPTPGLVELDDRRDRLVLLAFPRGRSEAPLYRGEHLRSLERRGRWELTIRGTRRRVYRVEASLATLARPFIPCAVEWNGRALAPDEWTYDARTRVLRAGWTGRRGHLVVREGC